MKTSFAAVTGIFCFTAACLTAGDTVPAPTLNPKFIKLTVKKKCSTKKVRSKEKFIRPETTSDFMHDDKTDYVTITVSVENRNKVDFLNCTLTVEIYGKSASEKKPFPAIFHTDTEKIERVEARKKIVKDFKSEMTYDKSPDYMEQKGTTARGNGTTKTYATPAFGTYFYGYRVILTDENGKEVSKTLWPSGLKKALEKIEMKKQEKNKEK